MDVSTGWGWPLNAAKPHFSAAADESLCGRWLYLGERKADRGSGSKQDCVACTRKAVVGGYITRPEAS